MRQANLPLNATKLLPSVTLLHGDCLNVMPTLPAKSAQMVFADLPYGVLKHRKWDVLIDLLAFWQCSARLLSDNRIMALTANMRLASALIQTNGSNFLYDIVWQKRYASNFLMAKKRVLCVHENVLMFGPRSHCFTPQMRPESLRSKINKKPKVKAITERSWHAGPVRRMLKEHGDLLPISVVQTFEARTGKVHPTQKPVALLEWLIRTYTNEGDTVLDPTAGSGTTAIAAMRTGRNSICIEKDDHYFAVMQKRVADERARLENE